MAASITRETRATKLKLIAEFATALQPAAWEILRISRADTTRRSMRSWDMTVLLEPPAKRS